MTTLDSGPLPRLLHAHIFKNGGTTLDWIFRRNFEHGFREVHGDRADATLIEPDVVALLRDGPSSTVFSSHHFRFPFDNLPNTYSLTLLRHPLDRVASIYEQERRMGHLPQGQGVADWVANCLEHRPYMVCDTQVIFLARGGVYYDPPDVLDLERAISVVDTLDFVGVVGDYDASMVLLEHELRRWWPAFDARYFPQNRSDRDPDINVRLQGLRELVGNDLYERLSINNAYDLRLVEHARQHLYRRLASIGDIEGAKREFAERCASLR